MEPYSNSNFVIYKQKIEKAILDGKWLRFDYVDVKMEITDRRVVEPYEVNNGVLVGRDVRKDGIRQFQLDGIQALEIIDKGEENVKPI